METTYKGHNIKATAHLIPGTEAWEPHTVVDGRRITFDPLNFKNRFFNNEQEAIDYALEYGKWLIDHPISGSTDSDEFLRHKRKTLPPLTTKCEICAKPTNQSFTFGQIHYYCEEHKEELFIRVTGKTPKKTGKPEK